MIPPDQSDWPVESAVVLEELVANQVGVLEGYYLILRNQKKINIFSASLNFLLNSIFF